MIQLAAPCRQQVDREAAAGLDRRVNGAAWKHLHFCVLSFSAHIGNERTVSQRVGRETLSIALPGATE